MTLKSLSDIDLTRPVLSDDCVYINRSWKQELVYFLMIDRFHDGAHRDLVQYSAEQFASTKPESLMNRFGGTFSGIQSQLAYIKNLGCTTIWLSPVFENYEETYHGYAICNFLNTDPRFGSTEALKELVKEAHRLGIRIVLDIVLNHTADTWKYKDQDPFYTGASFSFGEWRDSRFPIPTELRNSDFYKKAGAIRHWDSYPETQEGDIFELKKLILDDSPIGQEVLAIFVKIYSYWIKELDIDGFRLDTVKHLLPATVAKFCKEIREYATYLGKDSFMMIGETVGDDKLIEKYLKPVKTAGDYQKGIDAALDFPLHFILEDVVKGKRSVKALYEVYRSKAKMLRKLNREWSDLVVFSDNHDQIGQEYKTRLAHASSEKEVIAIIGFLYFLYGIPCIYYGTEQFFQGGGGHDCFLREAMFDEKQPICYQNSENSLYNELSKLALLRSELSIFGGADVEMDMISINGGVFIAPEEHLNLIYWSKRVFCDKLIVVYNALETKNQVVCVKLSNATMRINRKFNYYYGGKGVVEVHHREAYSFIEIELRPQQFVILK